MVTSARRALAGAFVALCLAATGASPGSAQTPALQRKAAGLEAIRADLDRSGTARVIVLLTGPRAPARSAAEAATAVERAATAAHRQAVREQQDAVLRAVLGASRAGRDIRRARMLPILVLEASEAELARLAADPRVEAIQSEGRGRAILTQSVPLVGGTAIEAAGATGSGQIVVVTDTGVQKSHAFIGAAKVVAEACFSSPYLPRGETTRCPNGTTSQIGPGAAEPCVGDNICDGHGTHVAGIAAGAQSAPDAGEPRAGVAPKASLFAIQVMIDDANGIDTWVYWSDLTLAFDHVLDRKDDFGTARIAAVNASLGGTTWTTTCDGAFPAMKAAVDALRSAGIATVFAAGNSGYADRVSEPSCISTVVTVGSTTKADAISTFSNIGAAVDLLAPGTAILSSVANGFSTSVFEAWSGTSMAAPHVAGAFAALRTRAPSASVDAIESVLEATGKPIADQIFTRPRIQLVEALGALAPSLTVDAGGLAFKGAAGGPWKPKRRTLKVAASAGTIGWSVTGVPKWLDVSPQSGDVGTGSTTVAISPSVKAARLRPGKYEAELLFVNASAPDQPPAVRRVRLTVKAGGKSVAARSTIEALVTRTQ